MCRLLIVLKIQVYISGEQSLFFDRLLATFLVDSKPFHPYCDNDAPELVSAFFVQPPSATVIIIISEMWIFAKRSKKCRIKMVKRIKRRCKKRQIKMRLVIDVKAMSSEITDRHNIFKAFIFLSFVKVFFSFASDFFYSFPLNWIPILCACVLRPYGFEHSSCCRKTKPN